METTRCMLGLMTHRALEHFRDPLTRHDIAYESSWLLFMLASIVALER
jgi:hypothetical protein